MIEAHLVAVGTELLKPDANETNTLFLKQTLHELGIDVSGVSVVSDNEILIENVLEYTLPQNDLVIFTGGLGPTEDDITIKAVAHFLGRSLRYDEAVKKHIEEFFINRNRPMPSNNLKQALIPTGSKIFINPNGTAPAVLIEERKHLIILLPGPPREMRPLFKEKIVPLLKKRFNLRPLLKKHFRLSGIPESATDAIAAPIYSKYEIVRSTILSEPGDIQLIFTAPATQTGAEALDKVSNEIMTALGSNIYSTDGKPLEAVIGKLLRQKKLTLSVAESCTGGLLSKRITDVPGSSEYFLGGIVCYSNNLKVNLVGVPAQIIESHGAVSSHTAAALAAGISSKTKSDIGIGITGIAGPGGGSEEKPVGLVYIGFAWKKDLTIKKFRFSGERSDIRKQATQMAMEVLRRIILQR